MMIEYSPLQQEEISQQSYLDTQSVRVAVVLSKRANMMRASLKKQLHQQFFLVKKLEELQSAAFDCLVVVEEDATAVSTFLGYFANEISNGADFCFSDCCFGVHGQTGCFYPNNKGSSQQMRVAGISASLFRSLELPTDATLGQVIATARSAAVNPKRIPHLLLWHHRPLRTEDLFAEDSARALLFTHEYSMTGAPLVLLGVVPELERQGYTVAAVGPRVDKLLQVYQQNGVIAVVDEGAVEDSSMVYLATNCDLVLANTICEYDTIDALSRNNIPAVWWLHDAQLGYPALANKLPKELNDCISVYCVSEYARRVFLKYCPKCSSDILMYALEDAAKLPTEEFPVPHPGKKLFTSVGTLEARKGQDVLCRMIESLPASVREQCMFLIVGRVIDKKMESLVKTLVQKYPDNVRYESFIPRSHINSVFRQTDCILCPSKDDPLPTFVTEGWMQGVPCICSENTGSAALIQDGVNSFVYYNDNPEQLKNKVMSFLRLNSQELEQMKKGCRAIYDEHFTMDVFAENIKKIISSSQTKCC